MASEENTKQGEQTSGDQAAGGPSGMDRNEGQTQNGTIGGSGSELENATERLGGNAEQIEKGEGEAGKESPASS